MAVATAKHFSAVEYIKKLREANFTEAQADVVAEIIEQQAQTIQEQGAKLTQIESKELATKGDVLSVKRDISETELRLQKEIETVRKEIVQANNKTILWIIGIMTGYSAFFLGILAKGFHWF